MGFDIIQGYGLSENSPVVCSNIIEKNILYSVGVPNLTSSKVKISNPDLSGQGEICVSGPCAMKGYYGDPEETKRKIIGGWLHTGDLGRIDKNGALYITGRIKELIITSSGKKYSPEIIENQIKSIEEIKDLAVVGMNIPHEFGEKICLAVVLDPAKKLVAESEEHFKEKVFQKIIHCSQALPSFTQINALYFID